MSVGAVLLGTIAAFLSGALALNSDFLMGFGRYTWDICYGPEGRTFPQTGNSLVLPLWLAALALAVSAAVLGHRIFSASKFRANASIAGPHPSGRDGGVVLGCGYVLLAAALLIVGPLLWLSSLHVGCF